MQDLRRLGIGRQEFRGVELDAQLDSGICGECARAYGPRVALLLARCQADAQFASAVDFKAPERRKLTEQGYTVLFSIGDQESDLAGGYAERTFKLPNPVYFLP
jgi:hypothetical protein